MPAWFVAAKTLLPYVSNIISAAIPVFTARQAPDKVPELIAQQISELQAAATGNAEAVKLLAEQMQKTLSALEQGAGDLEKKIRRARALSMLTGALAAAAIIIAGFALGR